MTNLLKRLNKLTPYFLKAKSLTVDGGFEIRPSRLNSILLGLDHVMFNFKHMGI